MVGDAAHSGGAGQGASMAIEDALALAAALQAEPTTAALKAYDAERRPRVVKLLGTADDNRGVKKAGPVKRRQQALLIRVFVPLFYEKATAWLYKLRTQPTPRPPAALTSPRPPGTVASPATQGSTWEKSPR
ncbi:hypothetical protein ACWCXB_08120 [Streptomyces sp. NPDC001514]